MGCTACGQGNSGSYKGDNCCLKAMDTVTPMNDIANGDQNFCFCGITDQICKNLRANEGIHPSATHSNTDCDDLSSLNDLATGSLHNALMTLNMCDVDAYKCWLDSLLSWDWNVDKAIICAICGLWDALQCIDKKTRQAVTTNVLWQGEENIFDLPTLNLGKSLSNFDYVDLHLSFGTERIVARITLSAGLGGIPTAVIMDKISNNNSAGIGGGGIAAKEIGVSFPSDTELKIDHFIWSITGCAPGTLDSAQPALFLPLSSTTKTKEYCDTQDFSQDKPHKVLAVEGITSRDTGSCIVNNG